KNLLTYNAFNQITDVTTLKGQHSHYVYDGSSREAKAVTVTGNIRYLIYISKQLIGEKFYDSDNKLHIVDYLGLAKIIDGIICEYYEKNYKGDITGILTKTKEGSYHLSQFNIYSPYGMVWHSMPKSADLPLYQQTLQGFDGEQTDPATGWQFLGAGHRVYNPAQRCFTSEDPASGGYAFGSNNPIMNTDPSGNIPHWLGNVFGVLNYAGTLGFAALHRKWAMITGTTVMMGLSTVATVAALVAEGAPTLLTAATAGYTAGINGVFIASAATPNKGLNIAGAIVGGIDAAVTLATACTGIASAGTSLVKRLASLEKKIVVMEMWHFVADDDVGRMPVGVNPHTYISIENQLDMNIIWNCYFKNLAGDMTRTDIPALLGIALNTTESIDTDLLYDLLRTEKQIKAGIRLQSEYDDMLETIVKSFGDFQLYEPAIRLESILPDGSEAIVIGQTRADRKKFIGFIYYMSNFKANQEYKKSWSMYVLQAQEHDADRIDFKYYVDNMVMGDAGPLEVSAIMFLKHYGFWG
ncbi:MAG: RHS repeat-associated core domain-containing protein, partial [Endozoicomonadaceae bacterium]|nr:RHS repeat-associated core domain-containing protein [Endozoicomonadaceae bacterium]